MKDQFAFLSQKKFWIEIVALVAALLVGAAAVYYFLIPGNLILGSISGLAMVICSLLESAGIAMKVSVMVLILNAFLLILAYVFLGPEVGLKTIIASLLLGPFMDFWAWICPYDRLIEPGLTSVMGDPIFDLLGFVLLLGASQAFLFRINASTGGLDIVAMIMKKYLHWDIGTSVTVSGVIVCLSSFLVNPFRLVVIGLIGTWFNGIVVDYFTVSLNKRKRVCIISNEYEKIRQYIISTLCRGCSMYEVKGGFRETPGVEIQTILTQSEFASLMEFVRKEDIHAFITAGNCSEIYGLWRPNRKKVKL
ncbi:MAG: YitT family protein [Candidatus Cryptobacteroides sp.]|nr:YitT family protein [Bacteroidales bacterium]MDY2859076.1 YitT family protein [Candidatus Cryptobacteroides sp.]MDD7153667.1 YitT family protein [Bacteroidales bacterium]MDY4571772.1 YitT family protein [Candidatus Cryptobacteroides sp.]MDY5442031.1 YitT family protein [Candidatus Cryptobacteroides sp.]